MGSPHSQAHSHTRTGTRSPTRTRSRAPSLRPSRTWPLTALAALYAVLLIGSNDVKAEQNLTTVQVDIVVQRLAEGAKQSWEVGTQQQALIEYQSPSFSVLNTSASLPPSSSAPSSLLPVISLISTVVHNKSLTVSSQNLSSPQPFFPTDGSAADPASNGVAALIANWTGSGNGSVDFEQAAREQMEFLWSDKVPKTGDGAFSHRVSQVQLWSDFIYMVPPFLAYYGVTTSNRSMLLAAYDQISLYRSYLLSNSTSTTQGLWAHVLLGSDFQDTGYWSTGNAWAAAGMVRVYGTIVNSEWGNTLKGELKDLRRWVDEIHEGMYRFIRDDGMFHNYVNDNSTFVDAASAALLASTVYRHALLTQTYTHLPTAEFVRRALWSPSTSPTPSLSNPDFSQNTSFVNSSSLMNMTHFDERGWLTPVVNPHSFGEVGRESPEGQAFVVEMWAAWRDWVDEGAVGANASGRGRGEVPGRAWVLGVVMLVGGAVVF